MGKLGKSALAYLLLLVAIVACALIYRYFGVLGGAVATGLVVVATAWSSWRDRKAQGKGKQRDANEVEPD
jgi:hypothetical protein